MDFPNQPRGIVPLDYQQAGTPADDMSSEEAEIYPKVFGPQFKFLPVPNSELPAIDQMMQALRDDMMALQHEYNSIVDWIMSTTDKVAGYLYTELHNDLIVKLPLSAAANNLRSGSTGFKNGLTHNDIKMVEHGYIGAIKNAKVTKAADLVSKYLQLINDYDLLPFLQKEQTDSVFMYWAEVIARNDPYQARYFLNNIMAFQVIPKIAMLYIKAIGLDTAIAFIDEMVENSYVRSFWESVPDGIEVNYYEQVLYAALDDLFIRASGAARDNTMGSIPDFLEKVHNKPGFNIDRLYHCTPPNVQSALRKSLRLRPDIQRPRKTKYAECKIFKAQLERAAVIGGGVLVWTKMP